MRGLPKLKVFLTAFVVVYILRSEYFPVVYVMLVHSDHVNISPFKMAKSNSRNTSGTVPSCYEVNLAI